MNFLKNCETDPGFCFILNNIDVLKFQTKLWKYTEVFITFQWMVLKNTMWYFKVQMKFRYRNSSLSLKIFTFLFSRKFDTLFENSDEILNIEGDTENSYFEWDNEFSNLGPNIPPKILIFKIFPLGFSKFLPGFSAS